MIRAFGLALLLCVLGAKVNAVAQREKSDVEMVAELKTHLKVGGTQAELSKVLERIRGKGKSDRADIYFEGDKIPDFDYVEKTSAACFVFRYFPFERDLGNGKKALAFRLNVLCTPKIREWYILEK